MRGARPADTRVTCFRSRSWYVRPTLGVLFMARTGTAAATAGLRYEWQWMVLSVLDVLDGKAQYVAPEPDAPGGRYEGGMGADFLVLEDGTQVWHVVKYGSRPWTIPRLAREGILRACWENVQDGGRFALDTRVGAPQLADLADAARSADSWTIFRHDYLETGRIQADFERLRDEWKASPEEAYLALKRTRVNEVSAESLADLIKSRLVGIVTGPPGIAEMTLERLVGDSPGRILAEGEVWEYLAAHGITRKAEKPLDARRQGRRAVAGLSSDTPSREDLLGVRGDVETLAELIAAVETRPPLAIALIGDWGTGKSSLMLQVEREIDALAMRSRNYPGMSAFAGNVRQVRFNAWHYSDDQLWAGLISHLFQVLAVPDLSNTDAPVPDAAKVQQDRDELRAKVKAQQEQCDKLDADLTATDRQSRPVGFLAGLDSPWGIARNLVTLIWLGARDVRAGASALVAWLAILGGAYLVWHFIAPWAGTVMAAAGTLAAPVVPALVKLWSWHQKATKFGSDQHARLVARQRAEREELRSLQEQLALVDAAAKLSSFLDDRGAPTAYGSYLGLPGRVRADLEQLAEALTQTRAEWAASGTPAPVPLERIVLYIDDLDRCPPGRVVEVLEAVHLMLTLDLFVVVVAVDARWLIRSLEYHHHDLFSTNMPASNGTAADGDASHLATPVDYLDKIFQIPYVVLPPAPDVIGRYLQALLPATDPSSGEMAVARPGADDDGLPAGAPLSQDQSGRANQDETPRDQANPLIEVEPVGVAGDNAVPIDLRPPGLELSRAEIEFMARLGGLIPTPRAAKRMVNIYRLVRIGIPDEELPAFTGDEKGGPYQAVQVLLAILTGSPTVAGDIFRALLEAPPADSVLSVLQEMRHEPSSREDLSGIENELIKLGAEAGLSLTTADCHCWCPELARFSFHTRDLARSGDKPATHIS